MKKCGVDTPDERTDHEPITGSRASHEQGSGQSPWSGGQRTKPPEAENLLAFAPNGSSKFSSFFKLQTMTAPTPSFRVKTHRICINLRNDIWQKWGGHVHPSPPPGDAPGRNVPCRIQCEITLA